MTSDPISTLIEQAAAVTARVSLVLPVIESDEAVVDRLVRERSGLAPCRRRSIKRRGES